MNEGAVVSIELRYVIRDDDRHGNVRYYLREPGKKKIRLRAEFGTDAFVEEYNRARSGDRPAFVIPRIKRTADGSFEWLVNAYFHSTDFRSELGDETQKVRRRILNKLCVTIGDKPFNRIEGNHVAAWMDHRADTPEAANGLLKTLRGLFKFAVKRKHLTVDPTKDLEKVKVETEGFHTWTIEEVRQFERHHPLGTVPRLAQALLLYTGQRRGDVVLLGWQHIQEGRLQFRQRKTRTMVYLPILPQLQEAIDAGPTGDMTFLVNKFARPFSAAGFGNAFRDWCDQAGLPHCTAHGLRKAGATIAADNGATDRQLMAIFGWKKAEMATLYTEAADKKRLSLDGIDKLVHRTPAEQNSPTFAKVEKGGTIKPEKSNKISRGA